MYKELMVGLNLESIEEGKVDQQSVCESGSEVSDSEQLDSLSNDDSVSC